MVQELGHVRLSKLEELTVKYGFPMSVELYEK